MLNKRNDSLLRQGALRNGLMCGELLVVLWMNSTYLECLHNLRLDDLRLDELRIERT